MSARIPAPMERIIRVMDPKDDRRAKWVAVWGILQRLERYAMNAVAPRPQVRFSIPMVRIKTLRLYPTRA